MTECDPKPKVLLPAPLSYLGRRLLRKLLDRGDVRLRVLVADRRNLGDAAEEIPEIVVGDPLDPEVLRRAAEGIDVAFYPVRFIDADPVFRQRRKVFPALFRDACIRAGVGRIVFLSAYGRDPGKNEYLAEHVEIGETLGAFPDRIRVVWFRAGFILGSGSLLFEALRNLAQKLPLLPAPRWMETKVTVIGVRDVLEYLIRAIRVPLERSVEVEIGLPSESVRDMVAATARVMGLKRAFLPLPFDAPRLSPYLLMVLTPYSARMASTFLRILEAMGTPAGGMSLAAAQELFPDIEPAPFEVAVARAIDAIEHEQVLSRFTDSLGRIPRTDAEEEMTRAVFRDVRKESFEGTAPEEIFRAVKSIGGKRGWFTFDLLWRIRGAADKLAGGYGASIGRRAESDLRVGDILDVWKVIDLRENRRLLLEAQMRVAGKAWLEFRIEGNTLVQTAYHYPKGLLGRLYWYSMLPFHAFVFRDMARGIVRRAQAGDGRAPVPGPRPGEAGSAPPAMRLGSGSRVAVLGGGPAGSFFTYLLLSMAQRERIDLHVDIFESKDFDTLGPPGCNMCGGIVSESMVQLLATEGIELPSTLVQRGIDSYVLHMDVGSVRIDTPRREKRIAAVHRGCGPLGAAGKTWENFDRYLLGLAEGRGAAVIRDRVTHVHRENGRPVVGTQGGRTGAYDLLAVAMGVNTAGLKLFENLDLGYRVPGTARAYICEFPLGREALRTHFGNSMHVFLLNLPRLEFAALIPKGEYVTVCLLGEGIDNELVDSFLDAAEVRRCFPPGWTVPKDFCRCFPSINVRGAGQPFADRIVFLGDSGVTRLYKDGIGGAYRTAKAAARTAVYCGLSARDFRRHFLPVCRALTWDNGIGKAIFQITRLIQKARPVRTAILRTTTAEQQRGAGLPRRMSGVLWDTFTGSAPYRDVFARMFHPRLLGRLAVETVSGLVRRGKHTTSP